MITFCLTSCNRLALLKRTLESFFKFNTAPIARYIIVDDSGQPGCIDEVKELWPQVEIYYNPERLGMVKNIDVAYSKVTTPYIFHCEDDWEFFDYGFIEKSLVLFETMPKLLTVWLRQEGDTNGHPIHDQVLSINDVQFKIVTYGYQGTFHGYTTNPGLRRLKDWPGFAGIIGDSKTGEHLISQYYFKHGYYAVILTPGAVRHTGWGQTTIQQ